MSEKASSPGRHRRYRLPLPPPKGRGLLLPALTALALLGLLAAGLFSSRSGGLGQAANVSANQSQAANAAPTATGGPIPAPVTGRPAIHTGNVSCDIIVPDHPLTAAGLATPYRLTGPHGQFPARTGCSMANNANLGAFVQATILDPATGQLSVYEPLVITNGTRPAVAPAVPKLPAGAVVTIDVGFNGTSLTQVGASPDALAEGHCVDSYGHSIFGQVSFCNGTDFFRAAFAAEQARKLVIPSDGTSPDTGAACLTTRSFQVVDQDPSDNVTTLYLLTHDGRTAQYSPANLAAMPHATTISNGSDNALLDDFLDPALHCQPFTAPDLSQGGKPSTSQALDELAASRNQAFPAALVPENDEMVTIGASLSAAKTNLYRSNVGQPPVSPVTDRSSSPARFCQFMIDVQTPFLSQQASRLAQGPTPVPATGDNLLTFMANRLSQSFHNLGCGQFGLFDPVHVTLNPAGSAVAATFDTTHQTAH